MAGTRSAPAGDSAWGRSRAQARLRPLALLLAAWSGSPCPAAAAPARRPAVVVDLEVSGPAGAPPAVPATSAAALAGTMLVVNSLSEAARAELARALGRFAATLERRRNPLYVPLDDGAERAEVEALLRDFAPAFTAAAAMSAGAWASSEGDLMVRGVQRCAPGASCIHLASSSGGELDGRARFLAWPVGFAIVVEGADARDADRLAAAVRGRAAADSRIALVLTGADLHAPRKSRALGELARNAAAVLRAGGGRIEPLSGTLASIAAVSSAPDALTWLSLPREALLVVPRLGALGSADAFVGETRALLEGAGSPVVWVMSPRRRS